MTEIVRILSEVSQSKEFAVLKKATEYGKSAGIPVIEFTSEKIAAQINNNSLDILVRVALHEACLAEQVPFKLIKRTSN
ncbi:MAG TPA: hypothetical protein VNF06_03015 [Candidatus Aquilonibacter sp.]|nr:hypothetical protein [Candidatus Aquilonibacter sp.]